MTFPNTRSLLKAAILSATGLLLTGCSGAAMDCGSNDVVAIVNESLVEEMEAGLNPLGGIAEALGGDAADRLGTMFGNEHPTATVTTSQWREHIGYDASIKKRYCEATATIKISGLDEQSGMLSMGLLLNGVNPQILSDGFEINVQYTVQVAGDENIVELIVQ